MNPLYCLTPVSPVGRRCRLVSPTEARALRTNQLFCLTPVSLVGWRHEVVPPEPESYLLKHNSIKPCTFCGASIKINMYRHVARCHLQLAQLWRCPVPWCTIWRGTPQDVMTHLVTGHRLPEKIKRISLQKLFPLWTVTREQYAESLSPRRSGISNDALLFSEVGLTLVHYYRVHSAGLPHAMFRGKYLAQLRLLLPR